MPRKPGKVPAYCLHKASGQAIVRIDGADHYLGPYGSDESHASYERAVSEWRAKRSDAVGGASHSVSGSRQQDRTVEAVLALYWQHAKSYYAREGAPTKELACMKYAIRPVRRLYAQTPARDFGPLALKAVRQHMIDSGLCRGQVNARVNRIKRVFKWAVSEELVPPHVFEGLRTVTGLRFGRTEARETEPIKPVDDATVEAVLPFVAPEVAAMIRLQRLTGMRPCEVVQIRMSDIDSTGDVWVFEPRDHKNRWRGQSRLIPLGPKAQAIVKAFQPANPTDHLFSPAVAEERRNADRRRDRRTPMTPSQSKRQRKLAPRRPKGSQYDVDSYRRAITYGIHKAGKHGVTVPHWHPNQLRHSRATELRRLHGIEAAQVSLGHARADVTQIYAEKNIALAMQIAKQTG